MQDLLSQLNEAQRQAVQTIEGPLLVLAGAGSGKTRVLTYRIAYMMEQGVRPWNILAITFTNKAAREMAERVEALIGAAAADMWVKTFHSACVRILRRDIDRIGYDRSFNIIDADDQKTLVKECLRELGFDDKEFPPRSVLGMISSAKDELQTPTQFALEHGNEFRYTQVAKVYTLYQKKLKTANCLDFDDLIVLTVRLFQEAPDVLEFYQNKFRYVLVDEYQDTNNAQNMLIGLLAKEHRNLCVVGDDDQSIYKFRGANIQNILDFEKAFSEAKVIRLEQNYRSTQTILDAANKVIENNHGRKGKNLWTESGSGDLIQVYRAHNEYDEAEYIAGEIARLHRDGCRFSDMAVLYRANAASRTIEDMFMRSAIPYRVLSGLRFYDRMEIRDMIAYLRLIKNHADDISLKRIINTPSRKIGKVTLDSIAAIAAREGCSMYQAIGGHLSEFKGGVATFYSLIEELSTMANTLPMDELVNTVFERSGYAMLLQKDEKGEERIANVAELVNGAKHYSETVEEPSFDDYMDNLALVSDIDNYDEDLDAVVLMTMHAAKGLEFPIVYIAAMDDGIFPSFMSIYSEEDLEEERRLCYVGITRAREKLYITGAHQRMVYGKTSPYRPSRFLEEIPTDLTEVHDARAAATAQQMAYDFTKSAQREPMMQTTLVQKQKPEANGRLNFKVGDVVSHRKFGRGVILSAEPVGNDVHYSIAFDSVGTKNLLGLYAKLTKTD